ncbi:MAG: hypothetical protein Q8K70_10015 [Bacteroidota bacterium]|nr:hypothetical protein [Bacteroidota bacterium]
MKYIAIFLLIIIISCQNNKIIYRDDLLQIKNKDFFSNSYTIAYDSKNILNKNNWELLFYSVDNKKMVNYVDSSMLSFRLINDSNVLIKHNKSDSFSVKYYKYNKYYNFPPDTVFLKYFNLDSSYLEDFMYVSIINNNKVEIDLGTISKNYLTMNIRVSSLILKGKPRKFSLCFKRKQW